MSNNFFYNFLLNMWVSNKIDLETLNSYVPKFITEEERTSIEQTPQNI